MNCWQCLKQIRYLLKSRDWTGSSNNVFHPNSVVVSADGEIPVLASCVVPLAIIKAGDAQMDPEFGEEHTLIRRTINLMLVTAIPGDAGTGENAILGANRTGGATKSEGRGLLELEEEVFGALAELDDVDGISIRWSASSGAAVQPIDLGGTIKYIAGMEYAFELLCTAARYYHPARSFTATGGSGSVALSWSLPPDRYDRYKMILRRASGATAPTSATDGTGVTLASDLATSVTDTVAAGTYSYALFAAYDETHSTPSTAERYSAAVTETSVVVT